MNTYLIVCGIIIFLLTAKAGGGGFLAGLMLSAVIAPIWFIIWLVTPDDPEPYPPNYFCDQYHPNCEAP